MKKDYYFCYSKPIHKYLSEQKGIEFVCAALHERSGEKFWLYEKTDQVKKELNTYHAVMNQLKQY